MQEGFQPQSDQPQGFGNEQQPQQATPQQQNDKKDNGLTEVIVFWEKVSKNNAVYYSGKDKMDNEYVMFKNQFKKNPNEPDWKLYKKAPRS